MKGGRNEGRKEGRKEERKDEREIDPVVMECRMKREVDERRSD